MDARHKAGHDEHHMNRPEAVSLPSPFFREEHEALRTQVRRFVESEIKPHGHY